MARIPPVSRDTFLSLILSVLVVSSLIDKCQHHVLRNQNHRIEASVDALAGAYDASRGDFRSQVIANQSVMMDDLTSLRKHLLKKETTP